jgi:hypothetical protein
LNENRREMQAGCQCKQGAHGPDSQIPRPPIKIGRYKQPERHQNAQYHKILVQGKTNGPIDMTIEHIQDSHSHTQQQARDGKRGKHTLEYANDAYHNEYVTYDCEYPTGKQIVRCVKDLKYCRTKERMIWHLSYTGKISINHFALRQQNTGGT